MNAYAIPGITKKKLPTVAEIQTAAEQVFGIPEDELYKKTNCRDYVYARNATFYFRRRYLQHGPSQLARESGWSHSNISQAIDKIENQFFEFNPEFTDKYNQMKGRLLI